VIEMKTIAAKVVDNFLQHGPPESPRPLMRALPPAELFPVDALGPVLAPAAKAIHDRVQAPMAICAQSVLGTAALVTQGYVNVELPIGGKRVKPISSYLVTVAESGERKTEADFQASWAIRKHEEDLREKHDAARQSYENDKIAWEKARDEAVKKTKSNRAATKLALDNLGPSPNEPLLPRLTCGEPTIEGLVKVFVKGWPSLGLFSDEGGMFVGGHGMTTEAKLRTVSNLSRLWDGNPIDRMRSGEGAALLPGRRLSVHLMMQPEVANILFQDRLLAGQGIHSRLLVSAPESAAGTRYPKQEKPETTQALEDYGRRLLDILKTPLPLRHGKMNELDPRALHLSMEAGKTWKVFVDHVERQMRPGGELESIKGLANKLPEHAARLAAIITLVGDIHAIEIDDDRMRAGIALAEYYAGEALRVFEGSKANVDLMLAQRLLDWLHWHWQGPAISLPDIYQYGPGAIRDKATAKRLVAVLVDHGWLMPILEGALIAGKRRREAWQIVKAEA